MTALERNCGWLLAAYPRSYREERAGEMLGTLLEAAGPGRPWPSWRETRALILGGLRLRVRAGLTQRLTPAAALAQAVLLAAVFQLTVSGTSDLGSAWIDRGRTVASAQPGWISLVLGLATLAAIAGAWSGLPWRFAVLALGTAGLWLYQAPARPPGQVILTVLALAVITILALRRRRLPRAWLWLAGALYLVLQLRWVFPGAVPLGALPTWFIILAATTAWCAVDMRPMLATALFMAAQFGTAFLSLMQPSGLGASDGLAFWQNAAVAAGSACLAIAAIRRLRRHAAL